jgi:hypothetical protein
MRKLALAAVAATGVALLPMNAQAGGFGGFGAGLAGAAIGAMAGAAIAAQQPHYVYVPYAVHHYHYAPRYYRPHYYRPRYYAAPRRVVRHEHITVDRSYSSY